MSDPSAPQSQVRPLTGRDGTPIIGVAGWKNSGKTTLVERLVTELTGRGLRVATVKHAHHAFAIDDDATDSARHRRAGAEQVAIVSAARWAIVRELRNAPEPSLEAVVAALDPCDVIIVEGYKRAPIPKIEVRRTASFDRGPLAPGDSLVFAIAADHATVGAGLPVLALDDIVGLADLVVGRLRPQRRT
jgi:molybdopterin-guanine dinucleotide biosynthesis protein B